MKNNKSKMFLAITGMVFAFSITGYAGEIGFEMTHLQQVNSNEKIGCSIVGEDGECLAWGWGRSLICGPVSVLLVAAYVDNFTPTYDQIKELVDWMVEVGIYASANNYNGELTNALELKRILWERYDIDAEYISLREKTFNKSIELIADSLNRNEPVILGTFFNLNIMSGGHFLCANKLRDNNEDGDYSDDDDQIFVTDPGHEASYEGQRWYKIEQLRSAWGGVIILNYEADEDSSDKADSDDDASCFIGSSKI